MFYFKCNILANIIIINGNENQTTMIIIIIESLIKHRHKNTLNVKLMIVN
jgi:hypothetical protein